LVNALSTALVCRVTTTALAQLKAAMSGRIDAGSKALVPGLTTTRTPIRPTNVAAQRRCPTFSPRTTTDSAVMKIGAAKLVAVASAMGRYRSEEMKRMEDVTRANPRKTWRPGL